MKDIRIMGMVEPFFRNTPDAPAIFKENGQVLTYKQIDQTVGAMSDFLVSRGVRINQRIAVVNPDGMAMAIAYLAVSNVASIVPLSPDYSEEQYRYYFTILKTEILLVPEDYDISMQKAAKELNMLIFYMQEKKQNKEIIYELSGGEWQNKEIILAKGEDIATVLFTSGTTSLPKIVPRSHKNTYYSTIKRITEMNLTSRDKVIFTFPVYRGINLHDTLAVLASGGSLIYLNGSTPEKLFNTINEACPTWLTGSPVLFHAIAEYYEANNLQQINSSLNSIRSSGAPLSKELENRLKNIFGVPVYAAYGLTETGNIASSQNSPAGIKHGSVGVPINVEVGIINDAGVVFDRNIIGEVAIRGPQVISRYDNDEQINKESFYGEWFRTGDGGYLDEDGYLFITGRFKEIINRGGEKISPYEVEDAISKHPNVLQVAVFPIPGLAGSEDVGAAVVLREGSCLYLKELRRFLNGKIIAFKMPVKIYVMQVIPFSEAGKVQRKNLYEKITALKILPQPEADANEKIILPRNETELKLDKIFRKILPVKKISVIDTFFELGGDSLKAAALFTEIKKTFQIQIPLKYIFRNGAIEALAKYIDSNKSNKNLFPFLVPFQEEGSKTPIFLVHAAEGKAVIYRHIANNFDPERPFYSFDFNYEAGKWKHPLTFEQIARHYINDIRKVQPQGPYILAGQCIGGIIAYEMACQLKDVKQEVSLLVLFDSIIPGTDEIPHIKSKFARNINEIKSDRILNYLFNKWIYYRLQILKLFYKKCPEPLKPFILHFNNRKIIMSSARSAYKLKKFDSKVIFFKPENNLKTTKTLNSINQWSKYASNLEVVPIKGNHNSVFYEENAESSKKALEDVLTGL